MRRQHAALRVQNQWRRRQAQVRFRKDLCVVHRGLAALQARVRGGIARELARRRRRGCLVLQAQWRRVSAQTKYRNDREQMMKLQVGQLVGWLVVFTYLAGSHIG